MFSLLTKLKESQAEICKLVELIIQKKDGRNISTNKNVLITEQVCSICIEKVSVAFYTHANCAHLYLLCDNCVAQLSDSCAYCRTKSKMRKLIFQTLNEESSSHEKAEKIPRMD